MKNLVLVFCLSLTSVLFGQSMPDYVKDEIIVKFKPNVLKSKEGTSKFTNPVLSRLHSKVNVSEYQIIKNKLSNNTMVIKFDNIAFNLQEVISMYEETGFFEYVEPNYIASGSGVMNTVPNDSEYSKQWGLKNDGTFSNAPSVSGADIDMELAWDIEKGDPNMIVAVIDTGLRLSHPEFSGRIWTNSNEIYDGTDTDGNGFVDDVVAGWDFINNDNDPTDDNGHGTNVAGIALATGSNSIGYAGVNWRSKVMICKALDQNNSGTYSAMAGAIYYAVDNGAKVINMSIGGSSSSTALSDAIDYCYNNGVILVACMMNLNNNTSFFPAAYNKTIAVGSTDPDDKRSNPFFWNPSSGSNFGGHIDLVAPGNFMYGLSHNSNTNYGSYWGGTSQATPLVAGVISLLLAQNPSLTFEEVRIILRESSEDLIGDPSEDTQGFDIYYGYGRLNAFNALTHQILSNTDFEKVSDNIFIYPNPIKGDNTLKVSNLIEGNYNLIIYNTLGQKIANINTTTNSYSKIVQPLPTLNTGTYFLKIINNSNNISIFRKLIIK